MDGSRSQDDIAIEFSQWKQLSGPKSAKFQDANKLVTNVTELTKGKYM